MYIRINIFIHTYKYIYISTHLHAYRYIYIYIGAKIACERERGTWQCDGAAHALKAWLDPGSRVQWFELGHTLPYASNQRSLATFGTTQPVHEFLGSLPSDYMLCACTKAGMCSCMAVCMFVRTYASMYVCLHELHTDADSHTQIPDNHAGLRWHPQLANHIPWNNCNEQYSEYQTWRWQGVLASMCSHKYKYTTGEWNVSL